MPRHARVSPDGSVQHVLNRGNRKATIFHQPADYAHFTDLMADAIDHVPLRILAYCLMPNHWHLVVWVESGTSISSYIHWLATAHVLHYHRSNGTNGHLYQARFRNFLVQQEDYLYQVLRYVEANARTAKLVHCAEDWEWCSARGTRSADGRQIVSEWPLPKPPNWSSYLNCGIPHEELRQIRYSSRRQAPYGSGEWVTSVAEKFGMESRLSAIGRPLHDRKIEPEFHPAFE